MVPPLSGRKVVVTRAREQASEFSDLLKEAGAHVVEFPTIEIVPPEDWSPVDQAIAALEVYDWIIFTSVNGVRFFIQRLRERGRNLELLKKKKICAIGPRTKRELQESGLEVDFTPSVYRAEEVANGLRTEAIGGKRILLPRAGAARKILPETLRRAGGIVNEVRVYSAVRPSGSGATLERILREGVDVVAFTSSSTVQNFMELLPKRDLMDGVTVAVIGPVTGDAANRYGLKPAIVAVDYTIPALVQAIVEHFQKAPA